jgi:hypothetical protein
VDQRNAIANVGMAAADLLLKAIKGVYYAYWSQSYPVEFITPQLLAAGKGAAYRLLLMPFMMLVTPTCARAVTDFVARGGTVVAFAKCGMLNEKSWLWHDRPGGLTGLFGVRETGIAKSDSVTLLPESGADVFAGVSGWLEGYWHRQDFALDEATQILARYQDGRPAATLHSHGRGRAVLFGTHFDAAAVQPEATGHHRVFANLARMAGVERSFHVQGGPLLDGHLLTRSSREGDAWGLFVLINHGPEPARAGVHLSSLPASTNITDLFAGQRLAVESAPGGCTFEIALDGYASTALVIG